MKPDMILRQKKFQSFLLQNVQQTTLKNPQSPMVFNIDCMVPTVLKYCQTSSTYSQCYFDSCRLI